MNDPQATQKQVVEELKNMAEGIAPLAVVTAYRASDDGP
jgi:hypothetical protein